MHRTQLYLDESRYQYIISLAQKMGTSIASVFRMLIDEHIDMNSRNKNDSFFKVVGIASGTGESVAEHYEDILYGEGK